MDIVGQTVLCETTTLGAITHSQFLYGDTLSQSSSRTHTVRYFFSLPHFPHLVKIFLVFFAFSNILSCFSSGILEFQRKFIFQNSLSVTASHNLFQHQNYNF